MQQLIYVSDKANNYNKSDTIDILVAARKRNMERAITGLIVELDQSFYQILEGNQSDVEDIFQLIKTDSRHYNLRVLYQQPVLKREFGEWAMGYANNIDPQQLDDVNRMLHFFSQKTSFTEIEGDSIKMLLTSLKGQAA